MFSDPQEVFPSLVAFHTTARFRCTSWLLAQWLVHHASDCSRMCTLMCFIYAYSCACVIHAVLSMLSSQIVDWQSLIVVWLHACISSIVGGHMLCRVAVFTCETVQHLDLSWNGLEDVGCAALASALAENHALRVFDLSNTRMGCKPCAELSQALRQNTTLEMMFVNGNHIGDKGARELAQCLTENKTLRHLGMAVRSCWCHYILALARPVSSPWFRQRAILVFVLFRHAPGSQSCLSLQQCL